jgi:hypothetical protein
MSRELKSLNEQASNSFNKIKDKTIWRATSSEVLRNRPVDRQKIEQAIKSASDSLHDNSDRIIELIDETAPKKVKSILEFLDELEIDPELKIAISYIIASKDKDKIANLNKAIMCIEKVIKA